jgi:hypothetical protein
LRALICGGGSTCSLGKQFIGPKRAQTFLYFYIFILVVGYLKPCYLVQVGLERGQRCILGAFRNLQVQDWKLHFTLNLTQSQECGKEGTPTIGWGFVLLVINSLRLLYLPLCRCL